MSLGRDVRPIILEGSWWLHTSPLPLSSSCSCRRSHIWQVQSLVSHARSLTIWLWSSRLQRVSICAEFIDCVPLSSLSESGDVRWVTFASSNVVTGSISFETWIEASFEFMSLVWEFAWRLDLWSSLLVTPEGSDEEGELCWLEGTSLWALTEHSKLSIDALSGSSCTFPSSVTYPWGRPTFTKEPTTG